MFVVDDILIPDAVLDTPFMCNLDKCLGGCCVQGDTGAPLEPDEREQLEAVLPRVRKYLRPEALAVIEEDGLWKETSPGEFVITCVGKAECVFVTYDGPVAKCSIQKAYFADETIWEKPISCHLFPIRAVKYGDQQVLEYEEIPLCAPACKKGRRKGMQLFDFLKEPLTRKFGKAWYEKFRAACISRRAATGK